MEQSSLLLFNPLWHGAICCVLVLVASFRGLWIDTCGSSNFELGSPLVAPGLLEVWSLLVRREIRAGCFWVARASKDSMHIVSPNRVGDDKPLASEAKSTWEEAYLELYKLLFLSCLRLWTCLTIQIAYHIIVFLLWKRGHRRGWCLSRSLPGWCGGWSGEGPGGLLPG